MFTEYLLKVSIVLFYAPSLCKGSGIPKVVNLEVRGELVEGNIIKGFAEVAWCGGTPGKGVARYDCMLVEFRMCVKL